MAVYELLGTKVAFSDAEERFLDLFYKEQRVTAEVKARYQSWYKQAGSIEYVLNNLMTFEGRTIGEVVLQPLFQELAQYEIYDIGWDAYIQDCAHFPNMQQAGQRLQDQYDEIEHQRQAEAAYRENRKASRSRWSGGGFGLGGALKGAAEAAALNAVSGLGHSAVPFWARWGRTALAGSWPRWCGRPASTPGLSGLIPRFPPPWPSSRPCREATGRHRHPGSPV